MAEKEGLLSWVENCEWLSRLRLKPALSLMAVLVGLFLRVTFGVYKSIRLCFGIGIIIAALELVTESLLGVYCSK